jgi:hypothetical protein
MPQPPQQNCGNCRFMIDNYKDGNPRCHRYPPQAQDETDTGEPPLYARFEFHVWRFPEVDKDYWCGEWQPNN